MGILPWSSRNREGVQFFSTLIQPREKLNMARVLKLGFKLARKFTLLLTVGSGEKNVYSGFGLASDVAMC